MNGYYCHKCRQTISSSGHACMNLQQGQHAVFPQNTPPQPHYPPDMREIGAKLDRVLALLERILAK